MNKKTLKKSRNSEVLHTFYSLRGTCGGCGPCGCSGCGGSVLTATAQGAKWGQTTNAANYNRNYGA